MNEIITADNLRKKDKKTRLWNDMKRYRMLYLMLLPGALITLIFLYIPMAGLVIAFQDYNIGLGIMGSEWVGLEHFRELFTSTTGLNVIRNTVIISLYKLIFGLPAPIILALFINEVKNKFLKNAFQTASYMPYFISWIVVAGMIGNILSPNTGIVPLIINKLTGATNVSLMTEPKAFRTILIISHIWKGAGWDSIIYLAALAGIDTVQYEAAILDGANRFQRMIHITIPGILPMIVTLAILACGHILDAGFDQVFNMQNSMVMDVSDIIDTYVYRVGMVEMSYGFSSAVGLFKSVSGLVMLLVVNYISKKATSGEVGVW